MRVGNDEEGGGKPVDRRRSAVARQQRRMVDDGLVTRRCDHLHWNELRTVRQHVQLRADRSVLAQDFIQYNALTTPACKLEHSHVVGGGRLSCSCVGIYYSKNSLFIVPIFFPVFLFPNVGICVRVPICIYTCIYSTYFVRVQFFKNVVSYLNSHNNIRERYHLFSGIQLWRKWISFTYYFSPRPHPLCAFVDIYEIPI